MSCFKRIPLFLAFAAGLAACQPLPQPFKPEIKGRAAIGPLIRQPSYEVSESFRSGFLDAASGNAAFFAPGQREGHLQFDLPGYLMQRLRQARVVAEDLELDTCADATRYFSYRRTTLAGEPDYGRQISAIVLPA